jgi:hypothetical protein
MKAGSVCGLKLSPFIVCRGVKTIDPFGGRQRLDRSPKNTKPYLEVLLSIETRALFGLNLHYLTRVGELRKEALPKKNI